LYSTLKKKGINVQECWVIPVLTSSGNYVLKRVDSFEEYLSEIKRINEQNIANLINSKSKENNLVRIANIEQVIETFRDRIYQIDEYINNKRILPPMISRKNVSIPNIPGISYITEWQRKLSITKMNNALRKNTPGNIPGKLIDDLERYIYREHSGSVDSYLEKIQNIIFIFDTYPEFKLKLINGEINIYQLAIFDRDFMLSEYAKNPDKPTIKIRMNIIKQIKDSLNKSLSFKKQFMNSQILKDIVITNESKKIELLLFDLYGNNEYSNKSNIENLIKLLSMESFATRIVSGEISSEQLINIFNRIILGINKEISTITVSNLKPVKYNKLNTREIEALLSQERLHLQELNKEMYELNSVNNNGMFILYWKPPKNILSLSEMEQWNNLLIESKNKIKEVIDSEKNMIGPKLEYSKIVLQNIKPLISYKEVLMNKYKIKYDKESQVLESLIKKSENKIRLLQEERVRKIKLIYRVRKSLIKQKALVRDPLSTRSEYSGLNLDIIFELVQAHKRFLIVNSVNSVRGLRDPLGLLNVNRLLPLLDLFDLNTLNFRLKYINESMYNQAFYKITTEINNVLRGVVLKTDIEYLNESIDNIANVLGIELKNTEIPEKLETLIQNWPREVPGNNLGIMDNYSSDLFKKLLKVNSPFSFYNEFVIRDYSGILANSIALNKREVPKSDMVLYDPSTGNIGKKAYNGYLFRAYRLDKDVNGKPVIINSTREEENPRTGLYVRVPVTYEKPGNFYFIKVPIINPRNPDDNFVWKEVPQGAVMSLPDNYDSCSRFDNNGAECNNSRGLANSRCEYSEDTKLCRANYSENVNNFGIGNSPTGLSRWFKEKWVNVCKKEGNKYAKCGKIGKKYPYCRPSVRISLKTPKTVREIGERKLAEMCKRKKNSNKVRIN